MGRKLTELERMQKARGLIDTRATDNDGALIKRDQTVTMVDIFGSEQKTAVAYFVQDLMAKGFNNQQIIEAVKNKYDLTWTIRNVNTVKDLLHKMWRCEMVHTMNDQIAQELATIDTQIREAWSAWEFSKKGIERKRSRNEKSVGGSDDNTYDLTEVITESDKCAGDIKFLSHINDLGKERRKLLGLYAPEKKDVGNNGNNNIQLNIVGAGSGEEAASVMSAILNQGKQEQLDQPAQEAEVVEAVPIEVDQKEQELDRIMEELLNE